MKKQRILHILYPDKFTVPFIHLINKEFNPDDHFFLCVSEPDRELLSSVNNVGYFRNPFRRNLIRNTALLLKKAKESTKIILHGNRMNFYFFIFPWLLKKTFWIIQGFEFSDESVEQESKNVGSFLKRFVLKRVYGHITHIEEDSEFANKCFRSSAKFFYSHGYLSNVVSERNESQVSEESVGSPTKVLVGNSTSPSNHHLSIFEMLLPYSESDIAIYCPLSYGYYDEYKEGIIKAGKEMFGKKFIPMTQFMKVDEYLAFLATIDIAVFNHKRQEAMGVTIQLLYNGKVVYMNKNTTSFRSLIKMGMKLFDNSLIESEGLLTRRDVQKNRELIYSYYSYDRLISSWRDIFNHQ
jgi:dTDP-N-acetylfucosamine:lipid II N-acetylfucosaminyltransferase